MTPTDGALALMGRHVGEWTTEAVHRALPDTVLTGHATFEWLDGGPFLVARTHQDHPEVPDAIWVVGDTDGLQMHYFDARGVHRLFAARVAGDWCEFERGLDGASGFAQRLRHRFDGDGTITALAQLSRDGVTWEDDMTITYRRVPRAG